MRSSPGFSITTPALLVLLNGLVGSWAPPLTAQATAPTGCDLYEAMAERAQPSEERTYALIALKDCPASPVRARLLEKAIRQDDGPARQAALRSLEMHLGAASIPFLVELYDEQAAEDELVAELSVQYLSQLSTAVPAAHIADLGRIFVRGLSHRQARVRQAALLGLGRLDDKAHWPRIHTMLRSPTTPGEHIAALEAARLMKNRQEVAAREAAVRVLAARAPAPDLERAAIELLAGLGGPRALEALMIYMVQHPGSPNHKLLSQRLATLVDARQVQTCTIIQTSLHTLPTERSPITGVVAAYTVLYSVDATDLGYRLPPEQGVRPRESNWLQVRTTDGLRGWVHGSRVQRIVISRPDPDSPPESNASPPSPSDG